MHLGTIRACFGTGASRPHKSPPASSKHLNVCVDPNGRLLQDQIAPTVNFSAFRSADTAAHSVVTTCPSLNNRKAPKASQFFLRLHLPVEY